LSTTNPTWPDPGANPGRRGGKPATNRLSYGAALTVYYTRHKRTVSGDDVTPALVDYDEYVSSLHMHIAPADAT
jgi:hypothetical protein